MPHFAIIHSIFVKEVNMPGSRRKNKKSRTVWLTPDDMALLSDLAKTFGTPKSDVFKIAIRMLSNDKKPLDQTICEVINERKRTK